MLRRSRIVVLFAALATACAGSRSLSPDKSDADVAQDELYVGVVKKQDDPAPRTMAERARPAPAARAAATGIVPAPGAPDTFNTEAYDPVFENRFMTVSLHPLSTFSADVDTASYSNVRRFLERGQLPPPGAVRIEEMINAFRYDYPLPSGDVPFGVDVEVADAPWNPRHRLARIGLRGAEPAAGRRPPSNLVFLLDVSGSMRPPNKLPLVKAAIRMLTESLTGDDRVAIVVYAGAAGLVLPSTPADDRAVILDAIERLDAGGSTAGGEGIRLAYATAREGFLEGGVNRVILCTDGDFNVGVTNRSELIRTIESEAAGGVFLTVLGFGTGNYKDASLEQLADHGNGNYGYIDSKLEARRLLVEQIGATLVTIAKDVKLQVEFNPARVGAYRLIGYENRLLAAEDFNDDRRDAGEIGAGHTVTALYELVPADLADELPGVDPLRYRRAAAPTEAAGTDELFTLKLRYKDPDGDASRLVELPVRDAGMTLAGASADFKFAAAVAGFGMILRDSKYARELTLADVARLAEEGRGQTDLAYRDGLLDLVRRAERLRGDAIAVSR